MSEPRARFALHWSRRKPNCGARCHVNHAISLELGLSKAIGANEFALCWLCMNVCALWDETAPGLRHSAD